MYTSLTDKTSTELVILYHQKKGCDTIATVLYERYKKKIYKLCLRQIYAIGNNNQHLIYLDYVVNEIVEQVLVKIKKHSFKEFDFAFDDFLRTFVGAYMQAWLSRFPKRHNRVAVASRTFIEDKEDQVVYIDSEAYLKDYNLLVEHYSSEELEQQLVDMIGTLAPKEMMCVCFFYFDKQSISQIQFKMGLKRKEVQVLLQKGKKELRELLVKKVLQM